jgi:hypothetical protein
LGEKEERGWTGGCREEGTAGRDNKNKNKNKTRVGKMKEEKKGEKSMERMADGEERQGGRAARLK